MASNIVDLVINIADHRKEYFEVKAKMKDEEKGYVTYFLKSL